MFQERDTAGTQASIVDFFDSYWEALAALGWRAVILHSWQDLPEKIESDIDYAVEGVTSRELLDFLARFSREKGWRLVQVIEHEPSAFYCVCMQAQPPYAHLELDVTWQYRRLGHLLVPSEILFDGRRKTSNKSFMVPAAGAEFCYLLAKAAAKGKAFAEIRGSVDALLSQDAEGCYQAAIRTFGVVPAESGSGAPDKTFDWENWFETASCFSGVRSGRRLGLGEITLYLRRILQPTGFRLPLGGSEHQPDVAVVAATLAPVFRKVVLRGAIGIKDWPSVICDLIRTRLVIECVDKSRGQIDNSREAGVVDAIQNTLEKLASRLEARLARTWM
jgi:hypothetical protein